MDIAKTVSKRSKDPSTRHGACIVDPENRIISVGYNGLPRGLSDDGDIDGVSYWDKPLKYEIVIHAEENSILNTHADLTEATLYLYSEKGYYPCSRCAGMILQEGIKNIVLDFVIKENTDTYNWSYTKHLFEKAGVNIRVLNPW